MSMDKDLNPTSVITMMQAINSLIRLVNDTVIAIEKLKNGNPDEVDIEALKKKLLELPDLPELGPQ